MPGSDDISVRAHFLLKKFYGYDRFRPGQLDIIRAATSGQDVLVLMPTGGGKSVCYQIPAMMLPGVTIVISPLIALMNDQTAALMANGVPAAAIHSGLSEEQNRTTIEALASGHIKILYISPERLTLDLPYWPGTIKVSMIAVDEAHCISQWGHDFRPVYTALGELKQMMPAVPVMALTATADRVTREDIIERLALVDPFTYIGSFDRPNISISVQSDPGKAGRLAAVRRMVRKYPNDTGIVYCLSRKGTEDMCEAINKSGIRAECYHAGMSTDMRNRAQKAFINGDVPVICATIAFGMGIDKSNIRWVIHNNMPGNIESYYQEIGRAGRDGLPAEALMFYSLKDVILRQTFVEQSGQKELNSEKLSRVQRFAESDVCRRRVLLSYFGETTDHDCGNCDVCLNPPSRIDGTIIAQKAMSGIVRAGGSLSSRTLIDLLRGNMTVEVSKDRLHLLKTFGAGHDMSTREWHYYINQLLQLGLIEIAYKDNFRLRVTGFGQEVLYGRRTIELSLYVPQPPSRRSERKRTADTRRLDPTQQLFEQLKSVRKAIAVKDSVPAYVVFTDDTLLEMARKKPADVDEFINIKGVSERKAVRYGKQFIKAIRKFDGLGANLPEGTSIRETLILYNAGATISEIAELKRIKTGTVAEHIVTLINEDMISSFDRLLTRDVFERIHRCLKAHGDDTSMVYEELRDVFASETIKIAIAVANYHKRLNFSR